MRPESADVLARELDDIARIAPWQEELARLWWRSVYPAFEENARTAGVSP